MYTYAYHLRASAGGGGGHHSGVLLIYHISAIITRYPSFPMRKSEIKSFTDKIEYVINSEDCKQNEVKNYY
jgi:hypothetical protein